MFNFDIGIISDITITVGSITKAMIILSLLRMPKVLPDAWKQSNFHVKDSMLMAIGVLGSDCSCNFRSYLLLRASG